ncbi:glycosyltransferase family 9 protein [Marinihelvus fidelis]|uniref:Glycosyltransferase family 9 protein n=1 Tax=Marinihelvus fidelis TaxID=2613842 RepID=A0A5N0T6C0_9GAMM|nr:glycosyltransferase family 9 protein [Marinihelvus fidelis]KAA9130308.1 glycosyltransferase family 9 protein [Marinihelvus fidelis]
MVDKPAPIVRLDAPPDNICILRLSALGDVTHTVPVVRALRDHWPSTKITWIIGKLEHKLLQNLDDVEFIVFDKRGGWGAVRQLRERLHGRRFDVLLHMQVAMRANLLSRLVKAPVRLGWDKPRARDRHSWFINHTVAAVPFQHQVQGFLEFPRALGIDVATPRWDLPVSDTDRAWAEKQLPGDQHTLVISPCSSHTLRNWSVPRYATVADYAARSLGMRVVLSGGPSDLEREMAAAIHDEMRSEVIDLVGKDTLTQSMGLLERASVVMTPDSGPAHIASALGTPVIGLYAATWSRRSGPYNSLDLTVDRFTEAAQQFRDSTPEGLRWGTRIEEPGVMDLVDVDAVVEKLDEAVGL